MRQKSRCSRTCSGGRDRLLDRGAAARAHARRRRDGEPAAPASRRSGVDERRRIPAKRAPRAAVAADGAPAAPTHAPGASATASSSTAGLRRGEEHDLRAPPAPELIALRLMRDHARGLQVVEPALHALAMRAHEPRPLRALARDLAPAHHRRQPHDQLLDRRRVPRRARRMPEPEQVPLDRVGARLQPVVARRDTPARPRAPATATRTRPRARARQAAARAPAGTSDDAHQRDQKKESAPAAPPAPERTDRAREPAAASGRSRRSWTNRAHAGRRRLQAHEDPTPETGVEDPSDERLQFGKASMWAPRGAGVACKPHGRPGGTRSFSFWRPSSGGPRGSRKSAGLKEANAPRTPPIGALSTSYEEDGDAWEPRRGASLEGRADGGTRTPDPFITSEVLCQLSYVGVGREV